MSNIGILALMLAFTSHIHAFGDKCSFPDPAKEFTNERYEGRWYEIGKIQTKGGAFFERNCVCTSLDVTIIDKTTGDGIANNDCREKTVDGKWTNVTGTLTFDTWIRQEDGSRMDQHPHKPSKSVQQTICCGASGAPPSKCSLYEAEFRRKLQ